MRSPAICTFLLSSPLRLGDDSFLCSMLLMTACSSSRFSIWRPSRPRLAAVASSSSLELCDESGGEMVAPVGINISFTGGGDWRRLPYGSTLPFTRKASLFALPLIPVAKSRAAISSCCFCIDGLRRCFERYEEEPVERGRLGRSSEALSGLRWWPWSQDWLRLGAGLVGFDAAGESCDGGV